jgi:hypothetical protein
MRSKCVLLFLMPIIMTCVLYAPVRAQILNETQKLLASDGAVDDQFGFAVAISGNYSIAGARWDDDIGQNSGSAYVYNRNQNDTNTWSQIAKLKAPDGTSSDYFGGSVSISGDYAIVGMRRLVWNEVYRRWDKYGWVYVYYRNEGGIDVWGQVAKLQASDAEAGDSFGLYSVSISGDYVIVGALGDDDNGDLSGSAYVFYRNQGGTDAWGQMAKITASDAVEGARFGYTVAISGDYAIVGADLDQRQGAAYVFYRNQGYDNGWGQVAKLQASDYEIDDGFGKSVSISGDYAIVGAYRSENAELDTSAAYVFYRNQGGNDTWGQVTKLTAYGDSASGAGFGGSVSISDDYAVVGAQYVDGTGVGYVYHRNQGGDDTWGRVVNLKSPDITWNDYFGYSVSISSDNIMIGAYQDDDSGSNSGSAYVFQTPQPKRRFFWETQADTSVDEGVLLTYTVSAIDTTGNSLVYSAPRLPVGATFDSETQSFSWTPMYSQAGIDTAIFFVTNSEINLLDTVNIAVLNVPDVLTLPTLPAMNIGVGGTVILPIRGTLRDAYSLDMAFIVDSDIVTPDADFIQAHAFEHQQNAIVGWHANNDTISVSLASGNLQSISTDDEVIAELVFRVIPGTAPDSVVPLTWLTYPHTNVSDEPGLLVDGAIQVIMIYGDVSGDTHVTAYDASLILQHVLSILPSINEQRADVNDNGLITSLDAAWVLYKVINPGALFPVEGGSLPKIGTGGTRSLSWIQTGTEWHLVADNPRGIMAGELSLEVQGDAMQVAGSELAASKHEGSVLSVAFARLDSNDPVLLRLDGGSTLAAPPRIIEAQFNDGTVLWTEALPTEFTLEQNTPNPFNPSTTIRFSTTLESSVRLTIHNTTGQLIRTLIDSNTEAGAHQIVWDGMDDTGRAVSSGVYLYRLTSVEGMMVQKMLLVR